MSQQQRAGGLVARARRPVALAAAVVAVLLAVVGGWQTARSAHTVARETVDPRSVLAALPEPAAEGWRQSEGGPATTALSGTAVRCAHRARRWARGGETLILRVVSCPTPRDAEVYLWRELHPLVRGPGVYRIADGLLVARDSPLVVVLAARGTEVAIAIGGPTAAAGAGAADAGAADPSADPSTSTLTMDERMNLTIRLTRAQVALLAGPTPPTTGWFRGGSTALALFTLACFFALVLRGRHGVRWLWQGGKWWTDVTLAALRVSGASVLVRAAAGVAVLISVGSVLAWRSSVWSLALLCACVAVVAARPPHLFLPVACPRGAPRSLHRGRAGRLAVMLDAAALALMTVGLWVPCALFLLIDVSGLHGAPMLTHGAYDARYLGLWPGTGTAAAAAFVHVVPVAPLAEFGLWPVVGMLAVAGLLRRAAVGQEKRALCLGPAEVPPVLVLVDARDQTSGIRNRRIARAVTDACDLVAWTAWWWPRRFADQVGAWLGDLGPVVVMTPGDGPSKLDGRAANGHGFAAVVLVPAAAGTSTALFAYADRLLAGRAGVPLLVVAPPMTPPAARAWWERHQALVARTGGSGAAGVTDARAFSVPVGHAPFAALGASAAGVLVAARGVDGGWRYWGARTRGETAYAVALTRAVAATGVGSGDRPVRPAAVLPVAEDLLAIAWGSSQGNAVNAARLARAARAALPVDDPERAEATRLLLVALLSTSPPFIGADDPMREAVAVAREDTAARMAADAVRTETPPPAGTEPERFERFPLIQALVSAHPSGPPYSAYLLSRLVRALLERFELHDGQADLDELIEACRLEAEGAADGSRTATFLRAELATCLLVRYQSTGNRADLDEGIEIGCGLRASGAQRADPALLLTYSQTLLVRGELTGSRADLDEAIEVARAAAARIRSKRERQEAFELVTELLRQRAEVTRAAGDAREAVASAEECLAAGGDDVTQAARAVQLASALDILAGITGDPDDLRRARAAARTDPDIAARLPRDRDRAVVASNRVGGLIERARRDGGGVDIEEAVAAARQAVASAAGSHRALALRTLMAALILRCERTQDPDDLSAGIAAGREALGLLLAGTPSHADLLSELGIALIQRYGMVGDQDDAEESINLLRQAVAEMPENGPRRAMCLNNLAVGLEMRIDALAARAAGFESTWMGGMLILPDGFWDLWPTDLDDAVEAARAAAAIGPPDDPGQAATLGMLSRLLLRRAETASPTRASDLDEAAEAGRSGAAIRGGAPIHRAIAAAGWARARAGAGRWAAAVEGFEAAIELVDRVAARELTPTEHEQLLNHLGALGADAAVCAVRCERPDRALELFEQGRGVVLGRQLDTRTELTDLAGLHSRLARRFDQLRDELAGSVPDQDGGLGAADTERRRQAADEFDELVERIRGLPGFRDFLRPRRLADLRAAAAGGPVVTVAVSRFGSYALLLTEHGVVQPVPLPGLGLGSVQRRVDETLDSDGLGVTPDLLGWLWTELAEPVLRRLGIDGPPRTSPSGERLPWPRLWWCLSGPLAFLPVHGAARPNTPGDAVLDRVVSSYTPTLRALLHARSRPADDASTLGGGPAGTVLAVAMPVTPGEGHPRLDGAADEVENLHRLLGGRVVRLVGPEATYQTATAALRGARWAHFACHALSDPDSSAQSFLALHDHQTQPLTVLDVIRLRLTGAELAFLSACETSRPGGPLPDEGLHLTSAFQLAGVAHVVGTLWRVGDRPAEWFANGVYARLLDTFDVALAVHETVHEMRAAFPDSPLIWASHVHSGA